MSKGAWKKVQIINQNISHETTFAFTLLSHFSNTFNLDFCGENVCVKYVRAINNNLINIGNSCSICLSMESLRVTFSFSSSRSTEGKNIHFKSSQDNNWRKLIFNITMNCSWNLECLLLWNCQLICGEDGCLSQDDEVS